MKQFLLRLPSWQESVCLPTVSNAQLKGKGRKNYCIPTLGNEQKEQFLDRYVFARRATPHGFHQNAGARTPATGDETKRNFAQETRLESTKNKQCYRRLLKRPSNETVSIPATGTDSPASPDRRQGIPYFTLYAKRGGRTRLTGLRTSLNIMVKIGTSHSLKKDSIYIYDSEYVKQISCTGDKVILSITDQDALG